MSELENCCGTTCDKQKLKDELYKQDELIQCLTEILDIDYPHEIFEAISEIQMNKAYLETEYSDICKLLPNDARYLDPPDGGSVKPSEQMRRMIVDLQEQIKNCNNETLANRIAELDRENLIKDKKIAELAAQVERMHKSLLVALDLAESSQGNDWYVDGSSVCIVSDMISEYSKGIPGATKCLAEHDREVAARAGKAGFIAGWKNRNAVGPLRKMWSDDEIHELSEEYANKIKSGEFKV